MTIKELSQVLNINKEIRIYEEKIRQLHCPVKSPTLSDMPKGKETTGVVERAYDQIEKQEFLLCECKQKRIYEQNRILRFINSIDDSFTRQIFIYRFVDGLRWKKIARIVGGSNTEDGIKKIVYRYLEKSESCPECPENKS